MFEVFDHTADIGLRVRAPDFAAVLAEAARGMFTLIAADLGPYRVTVEDDVVIAGRDRSFLLLDWLDDLLFRFETRRIVFVKFDVHVTDAGITARIGGEPVDPTRHRLGREVKAVTYHELDVRDTVDGVEATVIFDI